MGLDRALGEHICFVLQLAVLVQHLVAHGGAAQGQLVVSGGLIGIGVGDVDELCLAAGASHDFLRHGSGVAGAGPENNSNRFHS